MKHINYLVVTTLLVTIILFIGFYDVKASIEIDSFAECYLNCQETTSGWTFERAKCNVSCVVEAYNKLTNPVNE